MRTQKLKFQRNENGSILIDILLAMSVIGVVAYTSASGLSQIELAMNSISTKQSLGTEVNELVESIRNNLESYQINYNFIPDGTSVYKNAELDLQNLPMAWDSGIQAPIDQCTTCRGRFGYSIQPYERFRGLYIVTIAVTHTEWPNPKKFQFVVTTK